MPVVSGVIPSMMQGVSQQPYALRLPSQAELVENAVASAVDGLAKRPPTQHKKKLIGGDYSTAHWHTINRDPTERYEVMVVNGDLKVFDMAGTEKTVAFPDGTDYLVTPSAPADSFVLVTVADYTWVVNQTVVTEMAATTKATRGHEALVWIRQGNYKTDYTIKLDGTHTVTYQTSATDLDTLRTNNIAAQIKIGIDAIGGAPYTVTAYGSTLHIVRVDGADFSISSTDSLGDQAIQVVKKAVQNFSELPRKAPDGYQVEITGDTANGFDTLFVEFDDSGAALQDGVWNEIPKPGRKIELDASTMPHILVRETDGTFTFKQAEYDDCGCGDLKITPEPSFVGQALSDVFFFRNRLGFLAGENMVLSVSGEYFNFWRGTATQILDTDPIDIAMSHDKVSILKHAVPWNEGLTLFADTTQFRQAAVDFLTPRTISVNAATEFESSLRAKPVGAGKNVYFAVAKGSYSGIMEYFSDGASRQADGNEVTNNVPRYIPGDITKLASSTNGNMLAVLCSGDQASIFTYHYFFVQNEKVQSAFMKWNFAAGEKVLNVDFIENTLWLVIQRADGVYLEVADLAPGKTDGSLTFAVALDRRVTPSQCSVSYNSTTNRTTIVLPYPEAGDVQIMAASGNTVTKPGYMIPHTRVNTTTITIKGDNQLNWFVGRPYAFRYRFSTIVRREDAVGGGLVAIDTGRLQIRAIALAIAATGYLRAEVTPLARDMSTKVFTGRSLGSLLDPIGAAAIEDGLFRFLVMANNKKVIIDLVNDTPLPCRLLNAEWEGFYEQRSVRVG